MTIEPTVASQTRYPYSALWAALYMVLFCAGLFPVTALSAKPYWPGPWESADVIVQYFQTHQSRVMLCIFLQFAATICLGVFTAITVSRLRELGAQSASSWVALFGGFLIVADGMGASLLMWALLHPVVARDPGAALGLYYTSYALGGPGFSVPMGLLMAGITLAAREKQLLPGWIVWMGAGLATVGLASWIHVALPGALFLVPLTRFPGFIWLLAVGVALSRQPRPLLERSEGKGEI